MRSNEVVGFLPVFDEWVQLLDGGRQIGAGIELVAPRAVAAFDAAVELGHARRQDVELDILGLAGGFELGHELGAAIDLDALELEGQVGFQLIEEQRGGSGGGAIVGSADGPLRDRAIAGEVANGLGRGEPDVDRIDLHDLAGFFGLELAWQAYGVDAFVLAGRMFRAFAQIRYGLDRAALDQLFQDASDLRDGAAEALLPQERRELVLAPHGVSLAQPLNGQRELRVMCGRRPRCKRTLAFCLRSGASHVSGLFARR
jgi:hypothetical protein